jgi:hypothetical protein
VSEASHEVIATPLTGFLQVKDPTPEEQSQLKEIWDYVVGQTKSENTSERLYTLRHIEQRLAAPRLGQTRVSQLYQYVTSDKQAKSAEKLRDSFLR